MNELTRYEQYRKFQFIGLLAADSCGVAQPVLAPRARRAFQALLEKVGLGFTGEASRFKEHMEPLPCAGS